MPFAIWEVVKPFITLKNFGWLILAILIALAAYKLDVKWNQRLEAGEAIVQAKWDAQKLIDKAAYDKSVVDSKAKDAAWTKQLQDAQNEADKQKQIANVAATVAHNSAIGLLSTTNIAETKLPNATKETSDQYTKVLTNVLNDCVDKYGQMGRIADQYRIAYEQLDSSWPTDNPMPISTSVVTETK